MKNNEWINLPVYDPQLYPKKIRDIAEKVGKSVEEIASIEKISPGTVLIEWVRRDDVMEIFRIIEYPDNPKMSIVLYLTGEQMVVNLPHKKLMNKIHKFLLSQPQYDFEVDGEFPPPTQEEIKEMEEPDDDIDN